MPRRRRGRVMRRALLALGAASLLAPAAVLAQQDGEHLYINFRATLPAGPAADPAWPRRRAHRDRAAGPESAELDRSGRGQHPLRDPQSDAAGPAGPTRAADPARMRGFPGRAGRADDRKRLRDGIARRGLHQGEALGQGRGQPVQGVARARRHVSGGAVLARPTVRQGHVPVPPEITLQWLAVIQAIVLCDTRDAKRPCPNPTAQAAPAPAK